MDDSRNEVLLRFDAPDGRLAVVLEDDGRVAYAYLLADEEIVADVWLYNGAPTPAEVDFDDEEAMPFLNPRPFASDRQPAALREDSAVRCRWLEDGVEVSVDGELLARLHAGDRPGQSRAAAQDGPLARPL